MTNVDPSKKYKIKKNYLKKQNKKTILRPLNDTKSLLVFQGVHFIWILNIELKSKIYSLWCGN